MHIAVRRNLVRLVALTTALLGARELPAQPVPLPSCPSATLRVEGEPLEVGRRVRFLQTRFLGTNGPGETAAEIRVGSCGVVTAVQAQRSDALVLRARFPEGCGDLPRFRMKLRYDDDCRAVTGRVFAGGRRLALFRALALLPPETTTSTTQPSGTTTSTTLPAFTRTGAVIVTASSLDAVAPGTYAPGADMQEIMAVWDADADRRVGHANGSLDVPFPRTIRRTGEFSFVLELAAGFADGADAVVATAFDDGGSFVAVHLRLDGTTAIPLFVSAGSMYPDGVVVTSEVITEAEVEIVSDDAGGPAHIRGRVVASPSFFMLSRTFHDGSPIPVIGTRLFSNDIEFTFDAPLEDA